MDKFKKASLEIDRIHRLDSNIKTENGKEFPAEYLYSQRMVETLKAFFPDASETIQLAARCQHFKRWEIPRGSYPMDRQGYHKWRVSLFEHQGNEAAKILKDVGYPDEVISEVKNLIRKKDLKTSPDTQLLEDITCLVFFKYYAADFSRKHHREKLKHIASGTLSKMSERAKNELKKMELESQITDLLQEISH